MKSSPLKPSAKPLRRYTWLKKVSAKRLRETPARRRCVDAVIARDGGCVFLTYVGTLALVLYGELVLDPVRKEVEWQGRRIPLNHQGPLTAHEPAHRRNADYLDPSSAICLCSFHNTFIENEPEFGYATGLLVRGNGLRLR